jgi:hypothetical protein
VKILKFFARAIACWLAINAVIVAVLAVSDWYIFRGDISKAEDAF